jgi:hypothetical protein
MRSSADVRRALRTGAALLLATPLALGAQGGAKRPEYQSLRFEERWPAQPQTGDPWDRLKHVALSHDGAVYLTVAGQARWRGEQAEHFGLAAGAGRNDAFGVTRLDVSGDLHVGSPLRLFAELRDASAVGRELPGGARPQDTDRWDVQNLFVELAAGSKLPNAHLRVGRQELSIGKERLVGVSDWSNARRSFDGVRADLAPDARTTVTLLGARPVLLSARHPNRADTNAALWGGVATRALGRGTTAQLLALEWDQKRATLPAPGRALTGAQHRLTSCLRVSGPLPRLGWLAYEVEGAAQTGHVAGRRIAAWSVVSELTATGARLPLAPSLTLGADLASGTRDSLGTTAGTFVPPYPSAHTWNGYVDIVGRENLAEQRAVATARLPVLGQLRAAVHQFARVSTQDAAYTKSGSVLRAASGDRTRHVGDELDLTLTRSVGRHLKLLGGYGHFAPGAFLRHAAAGASPEDWGFLGTTFTF